MYGINNIESYSEKKPIIIGIAGGSGSGKSTIAKKLSERLRCKVSLISSDNYFKKVLPKMISPINEKEYDDWNCPDSIDIENLLLKIKSEIKSNIDVILIEGSCVLYINEIRNLMDLKIFVDLDSDERMYRRIKRNMQWNMSMDEIADYYLESAKYREKEYYLNTKIYADIILNGNKDNDICMDMISTWIKSR